VSAILSRSAAACPEPASTDLHYVAITNALIDFDLTPRQFKLAVCLLSYRWFETSPILPSVKTLAGRMRCSVRTVQYAMKGLIAKRLIEVQYTYRPDGGQMSNLYLIGPALVPLLAPVPTRDSTRPSAGLHQGVQPAASKGNERKDPKGTSRSQPRGRPAQSTDDFFRGGLIPRRR
jgi:hypothetical protein